VRQLNNSDQAAGADYLVVGRPILAAPDPKAAAEAIVAEIARAKT
jgi:orotidine-5'-phosphate decarboxylase